MQSAHCWLLWMQPQIIHSPANLVLSALLQWSSTGYTCSLHYKRHFPSALSQIVPVLCTTFSTSLSIACVYPLLVAVWRFAALVSQIEFCVLKLTCVLIKCGAFACLPACIYSAVAQRRIGTEICPAVNWKELRELSELVKQWQLEDMFLNVSIKITNYKFLALWLSLNLAIGKSMHTNSIGSDVWIFSRGTWASGSSILPTMHF